MHDLMVRKENYYKFFRNFGIWTQKKKAIVPANTDILTYSMEQGPS